MMSINSSFLRRRAFILLAAVLSIGVMSCGPRQSHNGSMQNGGMTHVRFVDALRVQGVTVEVDSRIEQPFLTVEGTVLKLSLSDEFQGEPIQSFAYDSARDCNKDAERIAKDGSIRGMYVSWVAPPHFFKKDRVLVLYSGENEAVLRVLTNLLGEQFAGA